MSSSGNKPFRFSVLCNGTFPASEWREAARRAEGHGYAAIHVSDHVVGPGAVVETSGHPAAWVAAVPAMMAMADATTTLRVGSRVMCNEYRHPVIMAKEFATIDFFSGGRVDLGIGAGWLKDEYDALGLPFDRAGLRIERLDEAIQVIRQCFSGEPVDFEGSHYQVKNFTAAPEPVQKSGPPIMIGGGAQKMLRLAGRHADIVSLNFDNRSGRMGADQMRLSTAEATAQKVQWVREGAGDRFEEIEFEIGAYQSKITDDPKAFAEQMGAMVGLSVDEMLELPHALIGSIDEICEEMERRRELYGISYYSFGERQLEEFAPVVERMAGR